MASLMLTACASRPKINKSNLALGQLSLGNPQKAWTMMKAELNHPTVSSQEDLCSLHVNALQALQEVVKYDFAPDDPDKMAKRSYDYVIQNCYSLPRKIQLAENLYGTYLNQTNRPGLALPHFEKALRLSSKGSFGNAINHYNLGTCYSDMGITELRDDHYAKAIKIGSAYFKTRRQYKYSLEEFSEWNTFQKVLRQQMNRLSQKKTDPHRQPEMKKIWYKMAAINKKWYKKSDQYVEYTYGAKYFASAGDVPFAKNLLNDAKRLTQKYPYKNPAVAKLDLQSAEAQILQAESKYEQSAVLYQDWIDRFSQVSGKSNSANNYRLAGLAQEAAQHYDLAIKDLNQCIDGYEKRRQTFKVKSRGRVLSDLFITPYWGLTRSYAARYLAQGHEGDFQGALRTARLLRGRQFGELLGLDYHIDYRLDKSRLQLTPDELLLNLIVTDKALVLFAISYNWHDLFLIPIDGATFNQAARRAKSNLINLKQPDGFIQDIQFISNIVLSSIGNRLDRYKKLIVIPDGLLHGIPFSIMSKSVKSYEPLIIDHEIVSMPSISYLIKDRASDRKLVNNNILAFADPDYGSRKAKILLRNKEAFYKRAVNDLNLFSPLPETRTEVKNIAALFPASGVTAVFGAQATETRIKSMPLGQFRYIHFATHGILGNQLPDVHEPALVLAAESESSKQDGFLTASEVTDLKLDSEMTVLSACDTGSGEYFTGEGIMGLNRAFLLAGSKSVIVSLWPVASQATVDLMTQFYQHLRTGKSKSQSLRLAQLELMGKVKELASNQRGIKVSHKTSKATLSVHPYYWAPFVLVGE
ncbi:MAG: CHAT domain-containing protein [Proteobacteria bacterium]|nr:CHAT domain-containing protein [Pseudomonadota bacterium]